MLRNKAGFGLLELIVAVVIIGVLGTVMVYSYRQYVLRSYVAKGVQLARKVGEAVSGYYQETGKMPQSNRDIGIFVPVVAPGIDSVRLSAILGGRIVIKFKPHSGLVASDGSPAFLLLRPVIETSRAMHWVCVTDEGSVADRYRPKDCRMSS